MEAAVGRSAGLGVRLPTRRPAPPARAPVAACQVPRVLLRSPQEAGSLLLAAAGQPEWGAAAAAAAASPQQGAAAAPPAAGTAPSDNTWQLVYSGSNPASSTSSSSGSGSSGGAATLARPRRPTAAPCTAVGQRDADPRLVRLTQQLIACSGQGQVVAVLAAERLEAPDARRLLTYLERQGAGGAAVAAFRAMKTLGQPGAGALPAAVWTLVDAGCCFHCACAATACGQVGLPLQAATQAPNRPGGPLPANIGGRASSPAGCPLLRTKLIRMHSRRPKDTAVALALYDEMCQDSIAPDAVCFNTCLTAAGEWGQARKRRCRTWAGGWDS